MTKIRYIEGDATAPKGTGPAIICHVCNDIGGWGKGFVVAISRRWPEPEADYRRWHKAGSSEDFRLGATRLVPVSKGLWVANMVTQHGIRRSPKGQPPIRYDALGECLEALAKEALKHKASVHMPRIGCGLAGGKWPEVEALIKKYLLTRGVDVTVYDFAG